MQVVLEQTQVMALDLEKRITLWTHGAEQMAQALTVLHRSGTGAHRNYTHAAKINRTMWS